MNKILKLPTRWVVDGHDSEELQELEKMGVDKEFYQLINSI